MIGFLSGVVKKLPAAVLVQTGGVGYLVEVGPSLLTSVQNEQSVELFIHTHVKEEALKLFGFTSQADLALFELLLSVSGVGPRIALNLVDAGPDRLVGAVQNANVAFFRAIPRVGKKLAQKIIIDLKSKMGGLKEIELGPLSDTERDVAEGLKNLGFDEVSIQQVLSELDGRQSVEVLLKEAVKKLAKL